MLFESVKINSWHRTHIKDFARSTFGKDPLSILSNRSGMRASYGFGISLPKDLVTKIDSERGDIPRSRYVLRVLQRLYKDEDNIKGNAQDSLARRLKTLRLSESLKP